MRGQKRGEPMFHLVARIYNWLLRRLMNACHVVCVRRRHGKSFTRSVSCLENGAAINMIGVRAHHSLTDCEADRSYRANVSTFSCPVLVQWGWPFSVS